MYGRGKSRKTAFDPKVDPNTIKGGFIDDNARIFPLYTEKIAQSPADQIDEAAAKEVAQLIRGSLIYRLYENLIRKKKLKEKEMER